MYAMGKSTAEMRVVTREATTSKSRVNATIWHVRSRFGSSRRAVPLAWPTDNDSFGGARYVTGMDLPVFADAARRRRIDCEVHKTEFVAFSFMLPSISHC